jgi:hypothetical protein
MHVLVLLALAGSAAAAEGDCTVRCEYEADGKVIVTHDYTSGHTHHQ